MVITSIENPLVIKRIFAHLERKTELKEFIPFLESRTQIYLKLLPGVSIIFLIGRQVKIRGKSLEQEHKC